MLAKSMLALATGLAAKKNKTAELFTHTTKTNAFWVSEKVLRAHFHLIKAEVTNMFCVFQTS